MLAVSLSALLVVGMISLTIARAERWRRIGSAGFTYMQVVRPKQPRVFGLGGGQIVMATPASPADRAGLKRGDELVSINGVPITDEAGLRRLDSSVKSGDRVVYRIRRRNEIRDVAIRFDSPMRNGYLLATAVVNGFVALAFIAIGLLVFSRRPGDRRAKVFYAMVTFGAVTLLSATIFALDASNMRGILTGPSTKAIVALPVFVIGFLPLTLHLALIFPHDRPIVRKHPYVIRWVYGMPLTAIFISMVFVGLAIWAQTAGPSSLGRIDRPLDAITIVVSIIGGALIVRLALLRRREGSWRAILSRPFQTIFAAIGFLLALLWACVSLKWKVPAFTIGILAAVLPYLSVLSYPILSCIALYRSHRDAGLEERRQVKWPLWGTLIALISKIVFSIALYGTMFAILFGEQDFGNWSRIAQILQLIPTILYLLIPISFAVAIFKYRLMNIDVIIKKTVAYGILSGLIIVIYLVLVGGLGTMLVHVAGVQNQTMVIASTLVVALLFVPLRNRLQHLVDRNLFRQKYDYPQALRALAAETLTATDLRSFFSFSAELLQQALQNRSVVVFERRQEDLVSSAKIGLPDAILGSVRMDASAAEAIDRPLNPARRHLPESAASALRRVDAALAVPVRSQHVLQAVLAFGSKLSDREFDLEDLEFISSAADQIAVTVDRIRLRRDEEDFEQARAMQQSLLPAAVPKIEGVDLFGTWKPARAVGGDYYDLLRLSDTQLAVCIGDVAGKGMPAALLMSALQAAVRASAAPDVSPAELCERVRRVIVQSLAGGRFVTFFYCTIDTAARRIRYCDAGHNPPVLVRADGRAVRLDRGGPALSRLFSGTAFVGGEEPLLEGDRLVLFTDGVSEARDAEGNDYGEDRLEAFIAANRHSAARELIDRIIDSVSTFSGGRVDDDLTLVAVAVSS